MTMKGVDNSYRIRCSVTCITEYTVLCGDYRVSSLMLKSCIVRGGVSSGHDRGMRIGSQRTEMDGFPDFVLVAAIEHLLQP
jgi:hypothetical protein